MIGFKFRSSSQVCAYYSLGHFMSKMDHWPTRAQNPGAAWLSLAASVFASTTLFQVPVALEVVDRATCRLDLFCGWRHRYLMTPGSGSKQDVGSIR